MFFFSNVRICLSVTVSTDEEKSKEEGSPPSSEPDVGEKLIQSNGCTIQAALVLCRVNVIRFTVPDKQIRPIRDIMWAQV